VYVYRTIKWTPADRRVFRQCETAFAMITETLEEADTKAIHTVFDGDFSTREKIEKIVGLLDRILTKCDEDLAYFALDRVFKVPAVGAGQVALIEDPKVAQRAILEAREGFKERCIAAKVLLQRGIQLLDEPEYVANEVIDHTLEFIDKTVSSAGHGQTFKDHVSQQLQSIRYPENYQRQDNKDVMLERLIEALHDRVDSDLWSHEFSRVCEGLRNIMSRRPESEEID
jgi:hypothetical protein